MANKILSSHTTYSLTTTGQAVRLTYDDNGESSVTPIVTGSEKPDFSGVLHALGIKVSSVSSATKLRVAAFWDNGSTPVGAPLFVNEFDLEALGPTGIQGFAAVINRKYRRPQSGSAAATAGKGDLYLWINTDAGTCTLDAAEATFTPDDTAVLQLGS